MKNFSATECIMRCCIFPLTLICVVLLNVSVSYSQKPLSDSVDIFRLSLEDLLNMTISIASKSDEKLSDAPGAVSVVTSDELKRFGGNTLYDVLLRVPSLSAVGIYMTDRAVVAARGDQVAGSASHILLLVNGRPVREAIEGGIKSEMMKAFPVNIIDHIEVIRGPGSVLYGSNAFSAVINIITIEPGENIFGVSAVVGNHGTFGTSGKMVFIDGNHDRSILISGRYQTRDPWKTMLLDTNAVSIPDKAAGAYGEISYKNFKAMASYNQWEHFYAAPHRIGVFPHPYGTAQWKKVFADAGYSKAFGTQFSLDINATYSQSFFEVDSFPNTSRNSKDFTTEITGFYTPSPNLRIIAGGLFNYVKGIEHPVNAPYSKTTDSSKISGAGYIQADWQINNLIKVIAGIQINKPQNLKFDVNPRIGVLIFPSEYFNFKVLYAQAFRAPTLNENYIDFATLVGNPDLKPEKVHNIDVGINYMDEKLQLGLNGFFMLQKNIIVQTGTTIPREYNNVGEVIIYGCEMEGKTYLTQDLFASFSLLYQQSKDTSDNHNVTPVPDFGFKAGLSYASQKGLVISLFNIFQGDVDDKYNNKANPEAKSYDLLNGYISYDLQRVLNIPAVKKLSLFMELNNILNQEIWLPATGITPLGYTLPFDQGFAIKAGLNLEF